MSEERAYIGLGSNLGDRRAFLLAGIEALSALPGVCLEAVSSLYETPPEGYTRQPDFLNAALCLRTGLAPETLLKAMRRIEDQHQRQRTLHWGPRTLDLDLLVFGREHRQQRDLFLPHPRIEERCFVLAPLCEIAPDLRHPCTDRPFAACYQSLDCQRKVRCLGPLS